MVKATRQDWIKRIRLIIGFILVVVGFGISALVIILICSGSFELMSKPFLLYLTCGLISFFVGCWLSDTKENKPQSVIRSIFDGDPKKLA